jgi:hypothetical protein
LSIINSILILSPASKRFVLSFEETYTVMVGTYIWSYGSESVKEKFWDCVQIAKEVGQIEAIHVLLAENILTVGGFVRVRYVVELGAISGCVRNLQQLIYSALISHE